MATALILVHDDPGAAAVPFARAAGALRLRGTVREGTDGRTRWAVRASDAEWRRDATHVEVQQREPWFIEPGAADTTRIRVAPATGAAVLHRHALDVRPLFYLADGHGWVIATEARLLAPFLREVRFAPAALSDAINFRWVAGADALFAPIRQVVAGTTVSLAPGAPAHVTAHHQVAFAPAAAGTSFDGCVADADGVLRDAVRAAAAGSHELAVLVSGGIDSSVLAGIAAAEAGNVRAYIVNYDGYPNPEDERARKVAGWLGLDIEDVRVSESDLRGDWVGQMVERLEEPPRNVNNIAIAKLFARAAERGAVVVHGDGAEVMFGLADHARVRRFARWRTLAAPASWWPLRPLTARAGGRLGRRLAWLRDVAVDGFARRLDEIPYTAAARALLDPLTRGREPCRELGALIPDGGPPAHEDLQAFQAHTYLHSSLRRLERIAAPLGVPVAVPFLAARTVAFARTLPSACKFREGHGKPILRALCRRYLPDEVAAWPKLGFQTPDRDWVLGPASAAQAALFGDDASTIAALFPPGGLAAALALPDYELRWLLLTLETAARQLRDAGAGAA